jgi:predicted small integral membrane protein
MPPDICPRAIAPGQAAQPQANFVSYPGRFRMMAARVAKLLMVASLAAFAFIVTFDNITDYGTNFAFVRHVLSMDTTFPGNSLLYRAITAPLAWHTAYILIIATEGLTCAALVAGAVALLRNLRAGAEQFERAKRFTVIGVTLAFLLWFFGFMVVGGEWFAMWQSKIWNGQESAFRFYITALAVLLFVKQLDTELAPQMPE